MHQTTAFYSEVSPPPTFISWPFSRWNWVTWSHHGLLPPPVLQQNHSGISRTRFLRAQHCCCHPTNTTTTTRTVYGPFHGPPKCQKKTSSGLYGAREDNKRQTHRESDGHHSIQINQQSTSSIIPPFLRRTPFLPQPSHLSRLGTGTGICWIAYPVSSNQQSQRTEKPHCQNINHREQLTIVN